MDKDLLVRWLHVNMQFSSFVSLFFHQVRTRTRLSGAFQSAGNLQICLRDGGVPQLWTKVFLLLNYVFLKKLLPLVPTFFTGGIYCNNIHHQRILEFPGSSNKNLYQQKLFNWILFSIQKYRKNHNTSRADMRGFDTPRGHVIGVIPT